MAYVNVDTSEEGRDEVLAISTERGEVIFYDTKKGFTNDPASPIPMANSRCQFGGKAQGQTTRIKDFEVLRIQGAKPKKQDLVFVTCSSDGAVKLWCLTQDELSQVDKKSANKANKAGKVDKANEASRQVGRLLGSYETGDRITCLKAFVMTEPNDDVSDEEEFEGLSDDNEEEDSNESESE